MWIRLENFPNYEVSSLGKVRNVRTLRMLRPGDAKGYKFVILCRDGIPHVFYLHKLVARVFLGPCPKGYEIDHDDDDKSNNCVLNLCYRTHAENCQKSIHSKLTLDYAATIHDVYDPGTYDRELLALVFDVAPRTIIDVLSGATWKESNAS